MATKANLQVWGQMLPVFYNDFSQMVETVFGVMKYTTWEGLPDVVLPGTAWNSGDVAISKHSLRHQQAWQEEAFGYFHKHPRLSIRSGKGVGKTAFLSWLIICFLTTRLEDVKIPCTATSGHQLFDVLWSEVGKWIRQIPPEFRAFMPLVKTKDHISVAGHEGSRFATARTARREQPEALQGFHATNILLLVDEASGVDDLIFEAGEGTMSTHGAKTVLTGNPTRPGGYFYDTFHRDRGRWKNMRVSCVESKLVTTDYVDGMRAKWGEESNEFRVGVLGEFPLGHSQGIVPLYLVEQAVERDVVDVQSREVWGLDVARFGVDRTALAKRRGRVLVEPVRWWQGKDTMQTAGMVADEYFSLPAHQRPYEIVVDVIGIGAGVYDRLRELDLPVRSCNVAQRRNIAPGYRYYRDELWFRVREWFEQQDCRIPDDQDFISELTSVEYDIDSNGNKHVVNKGEIGWSPDLADAFVLTFAVEWKANAREERKKLARMTQPQYAVGDASYITGVLT